MGKAGKRGHVMIRIFKSPICSEEVSLFDDSEFHLRFSREPVDLFPDNLQSAAECHSATETRMTS